MENPNTNCLAGMSCPQCNSFGPYYISITTSVRVDDSGTTDYGHDKEWDDDSPCLCNDCGFEGTVLAFCEEGR